MNSSARSKYVSLAEWLATTGKVPVDGTDLSGTTVLMHAISTKPYLDIGFAQLMFTNGADINHCNRFGCTAAHDLIKVYVFDEPTVARSGKALSWFLEHGGDADIKNGDGMSARYMIGRMAPLTPLLSRVLAQFGSGGATGNGDEKKATKPASR